MAAVTSGTFDLDAVPEAWRAVVGGLLQVQRAQRTASALGLSEALSAVAEPVVLAIGGPVAEVVRKRVDAAQAAAHEAARAVLATAQVTRAGHAQTVGPEVVVRHNLPTERDAFVGRAADLATLHERLAGGAHLVSVLGIGGTGKTRLVLHYGWQHLVDWPGGVWFCDLSEARGADGIAVAVARALDVPLGKDDPIVQLGHAIAGRGRCLVVLDNFEQVARHARATLGPWLDRASEAAFVVTTREVLGLAGETAIPLAPLAAPDSVALFQVRAQAAKPGFAPSPDEVAAIEELVTLLDDLPLAIELAAARVRVLAPRKLLARMADRFRVLTSGGGRRDRQATLRATLDWSWELLAPWEQSALAQVCVFEGGFDPEAAEAVVELDGFDEAPWAMDAVQALVDKSLVRPVADGRFDLLVSVQVYAAEKLEALGLQGPTQVRHGAWFAGFGTQAAVKALDVHGGVALALALALELDNVVAACRRAVVRGDGAMAAATCRAACAVLQLQGPFAVGATLAASVLALPGLSGPDRGVVARCAAAALSDLGRMDEAQAHYDAALAVARELGDRPSEGVVLRSLGLLHSYQGHMDEARARSDAALAVAREVGDRESQGGVLSNLGLLHQTQGRTEEARAHYEAALAVAREVGTRRLECIVLSNLGNLHMDQGRMEEARAHFEAALAVDREVGDRRSEGIVLGNLGLLHMGQGRMEEARAHYDAALGVARELRHRRFEGYVLGSLGVLHLDGGRLDEARTHIDQGEALLRGVGDDLHLGILLCGRSALERAEGQLDAARATLTEVDALATSLGAGPDGELGQALAKARLAVEAP